MRPTPEFFSQHPSAGMIFSRRTGLESLHVLVQRSCDLNLADPPDGVVKRAPHLIILFGLS